MGEARLQEFWTSGRNKVMLALDSIPWEFKFNMHGPEFKFISSKMRFP